MQAIILAAGKGKRMRPLTNKIPKGLVKVAGVPVLQRLLNQLPKEVTEVILVIGYLGDQIQKFFGKNYKGKKIKYVVQKRRLGTAHAIKKCEHLIKDRFLLIFGDDIQDAKSFEKMVKHPLSALAFKTDPSKLAAFRIDKKGYLQEIVEKPQEFVSDLASIGSYVLDRRVFSYPMVKSERGEYEYADWVKKLCKEAKVKVVVAKFWLPINSLEQVSEAEKILNKSKLR